MAKGPRTVLPIPDGIADHWDLERLPEPIPLGGGYHNLVLRAGDVVLRIEEREPASVAWEHELLAWLAPEIPEIVAPIPAPDGSTFLVVGARVVSVLPFVAGGERTGVELAELLARIHSRGSRWPAARPRPGRPAFADLDWERNDWWDWSVVAKPRELVRAFEHTRAWVTSRPPLTVTPVHGDPAHKNLLVRDGAIAGLIDWEWARLDWAAVEVAVAAWTFAEHDPSAFMRAYASAGGPGSSDALEEGRRIQLLTNALYSLTRAAEPGSSVDRDWIHHLLSELRELP